MTSRRTTDALVETAIRGGQKAGLPIAAYDVLSGGVVRVYVINPSDHGKLTEAAKCDDIFETRSG